MATLLDLARNMRDLKKSIPLQASNLAAKAALVITYELTGITPVDTSRALSNWQLRVNSPANRSIFPYYPGYKGSTKKISEQYADYVALQNVKNKLPGQTIYITNNVEYVQDLNTGTTHTNQESPGFVERAVLKGRLYIRQVGLSTNQLTTGYVDKKFNIGE